jgi:SOS-response transcriptional repressor LexA
MQDDLHLLADGDQPTGVSLHAGFPNPALDVFGRHNALALDLNQLLIRHPSSSFLFRIAGEAWAEQGIFDGDIALIDRALTPRKLGLVITWQNDQFTIQRFELLPKREQPWGVVSAIIHQYT